MTTENQPYYGDLLAENERLRAENRRLMDHGSFIAKSNQARALQEELRQSREQTAAVERERDGIEEKLTQRSRDLDDANARLRAAKARAESAEREVTKLGRALMAKGADTTLEREVSKLRGELDQSQQALAVADLQWKGMLESSEMRRQEAGKTIERMGAEVSKLRERADEANRRCADALVEVARLQVAARADGERIEQMRLALMDCGYSAEEIDEGYELRAAVSPAATSTPEACPEFKKPLEFNCANCGVHFMAHASPAATTGEACKDCGASNAKACPVCGAFTCDGCAENADESCCPAPIEATGQHIPYGFAGRHGHPQCNGVVVSNGDGTLRCFGCGTALTDADASPIEAPGKGNDEWEVMVGIGRVCKRCKGLYPTHRSTCAPTNPTDKP